MAGRERRVGPLQQHHPGPRPSRDPRAHGVQPAALLGDQGVGRPLVTGRLAQGLDRAEHLLQRVRVDGQHLGRAAQVGERVVHHGDVDGADGAEVLGDHDVGVQAGQCTLVEVVEVLATSHGAGDVRVDLGGRQPLGQGRRRHDAAIPRRRRVVTLERHAHDVVTRADGEQDLGRGGEQRHDPHTATLR